ncbi:protein BNIP5 isoform X1 [Myotis daubentonii]|uniref:protein BNIP5 isoform X1 n=2 Tax=Myotis daubentonii TaxID=98922 RepID=UPI0028732992|nr:protein BNIP5 isoform X1 [Myotis daubentonii]
MVQLSREEGEEARTMELPQGPRKPLSQRRARSWDRSQKPRKDPESREGQYLSLPATPPRRAPAGRARDGSRHLGGPGSPEAPGPEALSLETAREWLTSEQRPPRDRKDKAQGRSQQGWLKTMLNFFLRTGPEEARDKAARRARAKEGLPPPADASEPRKKAHDKKAGRKKHGHRKHGDGDANGPPGQEAGGQDTAAAWRSQEASLGPGPRGGADPGPHQPVLMEGQGAGASEPSSQATGRRPEEPQKLDQLDQDTIIQMIVQLLRDVGDEWDEEVRDLAQFFPCPLQLQGSQREVAPQNPAPAAVRKKSQERKPSLRRASSHKKQGSEEPRRAGAADAPSPESRPAKRPSFLYMCVGGHRASISSSIDLEEPEVQEASSTDCGGPSPFEPPIHTGSRAPGEDLQPDKASECKEFIQKIVALLQDAEEQEGEKQLQAQEPEVASENPAPPCRKKSQEKKSSFRKAFSHKKHGSKEPKRAGAAGAASPESRRPRRPTHLPLCGGARRPSISSSVDPEDPEFRESSPAEGGRVGSSASPSEARSHEPEGRPPPGGACESKELVIQQLVALLPAVDGRLGEQIRRHPSLKKFFYQLPDSSLRKLAANLRRRGACSPEPGRGLTERPYQFAFDLANKYAGRNGHTALSLMGLRYPRLPHTEAPQNITSLDIQSPD